MSQTAIKYIAHSPAFSPRQNLNQTGSTYFNKSRSAFNSIHLKARKADSLPIRPEKNHQIGKNSSAGHLKCFKANFHPVGLQIPEPKAKRRSATNKTTHIYKQNQSRRKNVLSSSQPPSTCLLCA